MKLFRVWKVCLVVFVVSLVCCVATHATEGEGDNSGGVNATCNFQNAYQLLCDDNQSGTVKNGGASWHIYSTSDYSGPSYTTVSGILSGGVTVDNIKRDCPANKYGWYVAYGWDGRNNGSGYVHWGPAKHGDGIISNALYNSYRGALNFEQTKLWIQGTLGGTPVDRTIGYGRQLNEGVAEKLYKLMKGTSVIPDNTGYFCFSDEVYGSNFSGRTRAFEGGNTWANTPDDKRVDTGWINNGDKSVSLTVTSCNAAGGCDVMFRHALRRNNGKDATSYTIQRTSNSSSISSGTIASGTEKFTSVANGEMQIVKDDKVKMRPGQIVCEKMEFLVDGKSKRASTTACVKVVGDAQPDNASTLLDMKVKNNTVSKYNKYANTVYAKPDDNLTYKATYNPVLQYATNIIPDVMRINNGGKVANGGGRTLQILFNVTNGRPYWKNAFSVASEGLTPGFANNYRYVDGNVAKQEELNEYKVSKNNVGSVLKEVAKTNANTATSTTPKQVKFTLESGKMVGHIYTDAISAEARVVVPYNFKNRTEINTVDNTLYAGEKANISYTIFTEPKDNSTLGGDPYATLVKNPKWKVEICYGDRYENCYESEEEKGQYLHQNEGIYEIATKSDDSTKVSVNVPDVPAGTKVRVRSAVYPATSGASDNWQDAEGDHKWAYSDSVELIIAKKPSFQVWGGSVYSARDIQVLVAEKQHVAGLNNFDDVANGENNMNYVFGSWTELGLMANGAVSGLVSGAGTGYKSSRDALLAKSGVGVSELGGSEERVADYCLRSTLSFANDKCRSGIVGGLSGGAQNIDSEALVARFVDDEKDVIDVDLSSGESLGGIEIESGTTLYRKTGDLYISGDIKYKIDANYDSLASVPKIIIYASGDIRIDCKVKEIDAVLISKGNINTCADIEGGVPEVNSVMRSNELIINGAIIAETLTLGRTYGAATGVNSIVPAEIINYDSSLYLWANQKSDVTKTGKIVTTYQKELSPRY